MRSFTFDGLAVVVMAGTGFVALPALATGVTHNVIVRDFAFEPAQITVAPGDVIRWEWESGFHTVTSGSGCFWNPLFHAPVDQFNPVFEWTVLHPDQIGEESIDDGVVSYICLPHCGGHAMHGWITIETEAALGDLNGDGVVNVSDLLIMLTAWGACGQGPCAADLNGDGTVNVSDMLILLSNWG